MVTLASKLALCKQINVVGSVLSEKRFNSDHHHPSSPINSFYRQPHLRRHHWLFWTTAAMSWPLTWLPERVLSPDSSSRAVLALWGVPPPFTYFHIILSHNQTQNKHHMILDQWLGATDCSVRVCVTLHLCYFCGGVVCVCVSISGPNSHLARPPHSDCHS